MQSLAYGLACRGKEQGGWGVPATGWHPWHSLGWAGAQLAETETCLVECPPLNRDGFGSGTKHSESCWFTIIAEEWQPSYMHWKVPQPLKAREAQTKIPSEKELQNKYMHKRASSKDRADYLWISGAYSNLKWTILSHLWEGLIYTAESPSLSFVV